MIQTADYFIKNDNKPATFNTSWFYGYVWALLNEFQFLNLKQEKKKFPTFSLFLDTKIQGSIIVSHSKLFRTICTMPPLHYDVVSKSNKQKKKAELRKKSLLLNVKQRFSRAENYSYNRCVPCENSLQETPRKTGMRNKMKGSSAGEVKIIRIDDLEVAFWPKKGPWHRTPSLSERY